MFKNPLSAPVFVPTIIMAVLAIIGIVKHNTPKTEAEKVVKEQDRRAEDDQYVDKWFHYAKDRYGNCWVYNDRVIIPIECSKIGR